MNKNSVQLIFREGLRVECVVIIINFIRRYSAKVRKMSKVLLVMTLIISFIAIYTYFDNNRIKIVSQKIAINNLPDAFEGFTILQIGDLHGKSFGNSQKRLINKINSLDYDIIAITGDMMGTSKSGMEPFYQLLDGIEKKEYLFCVGGNDDPLYYIGKEKNKTPIGKLLESKGCNILITPYRIDRGKDHIWVFSLFNNNSLNTLPKDIIDKEFIIALSHYPLEENNCKNATRIGLPACDLVLAGHYHGGQLRIPFYGALFIPALNEFKLFPKQNTVSGLNEWGRYKQYVTRGLGASGNLPIFKFRLFDTPEINLITLVKEKKKL